MIHILMVEDDLELAEILTEYLEKFNIAVTTIDDPYMGLSTLALGKYDLMILDLTLPGMDGLELLKLIRQKSDIPIIISSARTDLTDKVIGLERGADDYLPKPYDPRELEVRIRTILRRLAPKEEEQESTKAIVLHKAKMEIHFNNQNLHLTGAEYGILEYLIEHENSVVSRETLIYNVDAINEESSNKSIDVIVGRIRNKLGESSKEPTYIHAVRGIGYKLLQ
jgi:two-component system, OmpR family, response regulator